MTAPHLIATATDSRRAASFWRCHCGTGLLVRHEGRHVAFQRGGRQWKRCPHCHRKLIVAWREAC